MKNISKSQVKEKSERKGKKPIEKDFTRIEVGVDPALVHPALLCYTKGFF